MGRLPGKQVLILGLGLGSIPIILDRLSYGEWDISAVEVDEEVCRLANVYATPKISSPMEVHVADAQSFLALNQTSFDLICVDLFVDDQIPEKFKTQDFLEELKGSLAPKGLLVFNTLAFRDSDKKESRDFFDGIFNTVFENGELVPVYKNYMLINDRTYLL
jgi:spermidine synthase